MKSTQRQPASPTTSESVNLQPKKTAVLATNPTAKKIILTRHNKFTQFCEERKFVGFTFLKIGNKINSKGEKKKDLLESPKWKKGGIDRSNYKSFIRSDHQGFAFITGEASGITVVDCDTNDAYAKIISDFPKIKDTLTVKTRKGAHLYFQFVPEITSSSHSFASRSDVDIRGVDGIIFAPPTEYDFFGEHCSYTFVNKDAEILAMPDPLKKDIRFTAESKKEGKKSTRKLKAITSQVDDKERKNRPIDAVAMAKTIRDHIGWLPDFYLESHDNWRRLGAIIHHELGDTSDAKQLFLELSRRAPSYRDVQMSDMDTMWPTYSSDKKSLITVASLIAEVNNANRIRDFGFLDDIDDEEVLGFANPHQKVQKKGMAFDQTQELDESDEVTIEKKFNFNNNISHATLAKFFVECYGSDLVQAFKLDGSGTSLYHWNAETKLWEPNIKAKIFILRTLSDEFFDALQRQARELNNHHRNVAFRDLAKLLQNHSNKESIFSEIQVHIPLKENIEFDTSRNHYNNLHFLNGTLMLDEVRMGEDGKVAYKEAFRPRIKEDYITKTLNWNFGPVDEDALSRVEEMFQQIQPDPQQLLFQKDWLAYCLTGNTGAHKFKMNIGYTAENGKSTEAKIHRKVFALYSTKLPKNTFAINNEKRHKYMIELLEQPIRYAYMEELDRAKLDSDLLKDWVDGEEQVVEVMYGTKLTRLSQAKITTSSNKDPNADADKGLLRRGMVQHYTSKFVSDPGQNPPPNVFKKTEQLDELFLKEDFRRAYLHMLLPHIARYYQKGLPIPSFAVLQFQKVMDEYDAFQTALFDVCERGTENDRVWKVDLVESLKDKLGRAITWEKSVLPELKRLGFVYNSSTRVDRRDPNSSLEKPRGAIIGLKWMT